MAKYARIRNGHLTDVYRVPEDFATLEALSLSLPGDDFIVVPDDALNGAADNGNGTYTNPQESTPTAPEFKTLAASTFIALVGGALGFARLDELLGKSKAVEALLMKAEKIDRNSGNTPAAIAYLKTGANALTDQELAIIDAAWKAL